MSIYDFRKEQTQDNPASSIQGASIAPQTITNSYVLQLQKGIGNQALSRLMGEKEWKNSAPIQRKNNTGLPDELKARVESLSGLSMDDVKVHYNSPRPAEVGAYAYTQGSNIHISPGQEEHLPHEAWHVVQQAKKNIQPTMEVQGVGINDDASLEKEADEMGAKINNGALNKGELQKSSSSKDELTNIHNSTIMQRVTIVQRNKELDDVKTTFNQQQAPVPDKAGLIEAIEKQIVEIGKEDGNLAVIATIREEMDVVLSTFTDGLVAAGLPEDPSILLQSKRHLSEARNLCELFYRRCLISTTDEDARTLKAEISTVLADSWRLVVEQKGPIETILTSTAKTGEREARKWRKDEGEITDNSIDIRSTMLAQAVTQSGYKPNLVIGLPTAGAHIAARVAGALNVSSEGVALTTKLMTVRPRYVKPSQDAEGRSQEQIDTDNMTMIEDELRSIIGDSVKVSVLIVDDFSKSGISLQLAKEKISQALLTLDYVAEIKTGVTRYTNAQLRDKLSTDQSEIDNPIDYVVGVYGTGRRTDIKQELLDEEGIFPNDKYADNIEYWERGLMEEGEDALAKVGIESEEEDGGCCVIM